MAALAVVAAAVACAAHGKRQSSGADPYLIEATELTSTSHNNLYDAIRQLRPSWFTRDIRGNSQPADRSIMVYINDRRAGSATELRNYPVTFPIRARYLSPTDAQVRYGQLNGMRPAIILETDRP